MITLNRLLRIAFFCLVLVLGGCSQTITNSEIIVSGEFLSEDTENRLVDTVYNKAEELGGYCRLQNAKLRYHRCIISRGRAEIRIGIGYDSKQKFVIIIGSTVGHGIPPADEKVVTGYYLPKLHKELEEWALTLIPPEAVVSAERSYVDYNASKDLW